MVCWGTINAPWISYTLLCYLSAQTADQRIDYSPRLRNIYGANCVAMRHMLGDIQDNDDKLNRNRRRRNNNQIIIDENCCLFSVFCYNYIVLFHPTSIKSNDLYDVTTNASISKRSHDYWTFLSDEWAKKKIVINFIRKCYQRGNTIAHGNNIWKI